jgi:hypothetical protein
MHPVRDAKQTDADKLFRRVVTGNAMSIHVTSRWLRFARLIRWFWRSLNERP